MTLLDSQLDPPAPRGRRRPHPGVARLPRRRRRHPRPRRRPPPPRPPARPGRGPDGLHALRQHHRRRRPARLPGRRRGRGPHRGPRAVERGGHGHPGQRPLRGHRRPPLDPGLGHRPLRDGLQPLLPGPGRRADGGEPGDQVFFQGHATPGIYARAFLEGRLGEDRSTASGGRSAAAGPVELPPPPAHARVLGVPDRLHGAGADQRHLPGPLQPLPGPPGHRRHQPVARVVLPGRRRVRRARVPRRPVDRGPRRASTT